MSAEPGPREIAAAPAPVADEAITGSRDICPRRFSQFFRASSDAARLTLIGCCIAILAAIAAGFLQSLLETHRDARSLVVEQWRASVAPEPVERASFVAAVLSILPAMIAFFFVGGRWSRNAGRDKTWSVGVCFGSIALLALVVISNQLWYMISGAQLSLSWRSLAALALLLMIALAASRLLFLWAPPFRLSARLYSAVSATLVATIAAAGGGLRLRSIDSMFGDIHFDSVFYAVSQSLAGKTVLADFPAQYGLYAEIAGYALALADSPTFGFIVAMAVMQAAASAAFAIFAFTYIKSLRLRILFALSTMLFVGTSWILRWLGPLGHEYYSLWPIRFFFPAVLLLVFSIVNSTRARARGITALAALCGVGIIWNYDWSIPVWGGFVALFLLRCFRAGPSRRNDIANFAIIASTPLIVILAFVTYLQHKSGWAVSLEDWLKYQWIFYGLGFGMFAIPINPHPWMALIIIYLYGLGYGVAALLSGRENARTDALLVLSVAGFGVFAYYQGRSHDTVLSLVVWPAITIAFILANDVLRAVRVRRAPQWAIWSAASATAFGLICAGIFAAGVPRFIAGAGATIGSIWINERAVVNADVAFIARWTSPGAPVFIAGPGQAILYAETGFASAISGPGDVELLLVEDFQKRIAALTSRPLDSVFIRAERSGALGNEYAPLLERYRIADRSPNGLLLLRPIGSSRR